MAQKKENIAVIINTASFERVAFALGLASSELILNKEVNVLFTYGGIVRLKKGLSDRLGEETNEWIRQEIRSSFDRGNMKISELLRDFKKLGGKIYACPAAMSLHSIVNGELVEEVDAVRGVVAFITEEKNEDAKIIYI